jgi:N-formylglutamate deformylase
VSDRSGTSADPAFTAWVADTLRALGFRVQINDPYRGGDLVRSYGNPAAQRHSIQIELNRALYMNEATCEKHDGFEVLRGQLTRFVEALRGYVGEQLRHEQLNNQKG